MKQKREQKRDLGQQDNRQIAASLKEMVAIGQGVWELLVYHSDFLQGSMTPWASAEQLQALRLFAQLGVAIIDAPATQPRLCLTCDTAFRLPDQMPDMIVVLKPDAKAPCPAMLQALCVRCANRDQPAVNEAILAAMKRYMFDDVRTFVRHAPGHA